jgi:hypothetical protein
MQQQPIYLGKNLTQQVTLSNLIFSNAPYRHSLTLFISSLDYLSFSQSPPGFCTTTIVNVAIGILYFIDKKAGRWRWITKTTTEG